MAKNNNMIIYSILFPGKKLGGGRFLFLLIENGISSDLEGNGSLVKYSIHGWFTVEEWGWRYERVQGSAIERNWAIASFYFCAAYFIDVFTNSEKNNAKIVVNVGGIANQRRVQLSFAGAYVRTHIGEQNLSNLGGGS